MGKLAQSHPAQTACLVDEAKALRLFADFTKSCVQVIPETTGSGWASLSVVVEHFVDVPLNERMEP